MPFVSGAGFSTNTPGWPGPPAVFDDAVLTLTGPGSLTSWANTGTGGSALDAVPVSVRGCATNPEQDPAWFAVHTSTNVVTGFSTPDAAANNCDSADLISVRAKWRAIGDSEAAGTEDGSMAFGKITSLNTGTPGYADPDWSIWVGLAAPFTPGGLNAIWYDDGDVQQSYGTDAVVDPYGWCEVRWDLLIDGPGSDSTLTFYTGQDGVWTQVGNVTTITGGTTVRDNGGPVVAAAMSTMVEYCELWKDGVLAVSFRPDVPNTTRGPNDTWTAATGETWTTRADSAVLANPGTSAYVCGGSTAWRVPDSDLLDIGTDDWTTGQALTVPAVADTNGEAFDYITKQTGSVGTGGTGWRLSDLRVDAFGIDGFGVLAADGSDIAASISNTGWTAGAAHTVIDAFDRDGNLVTYVDGTARGSAAMAAVGSLTTSTALIFGFAGKPPFLLFSHVEWPTLLTPTEIASAAAALTPPD